MLGLNRLARTVKGGFWLVRGGGLRHRIDQLEERAASLDCYERQRWGEVADRIDRLVGDVGRLAAQMEERLQAVDARAAAMQQAGKDQWSTLNLRLDQSVLEDQATASRNEERLSGIGGVSQAAADRAFEALRIVERIEHLLRSRSRVFGHEMFLDPTDSIVSRCLLEDGYFEPYETSLIQSEIQPGDVVLDIGANIGYYTLIFARLVGEHGRVYAFEPDPTNFRLLKKNINANGYQNVVLVPKAVTDRSEIRRLFLCPDNKGDHRLFDSHDDRDSVLTETTTLDEHFAEFQGEINFIKMDIQGSEGRAVRGMRDLLSRHGDVRIMSEFWPAGLLRSGVNARDYLSDLQELGFHLFRIDEDSETTEAISAGELLELYPDDNEAFTNLYCSRSA